MSARGQSIQDYKKMINFSTNTRCNCITEAQSTFDNVDIPFVTMKSLINNTIYQHESLLSISNKSEKALRVHYDPIETR